jgi:hypothetical protein
MAQTALLVQFSHEVSSSPSPPELEPTKRTPNMRHSANLNPLPYTLKIRNEL